MNRCAELRMGRIAALALGAALLLAVAGCAQKSAKPDHPSPPSTAPGAETATAPLADKGDPEARFAEALALMKQRKSAQAEAAFMGLSRDFPEFAGPQTNLGILFAKSKRRDAAIAAFTRAATANGQNASAFNWIGILNREAGDFVRAREAYEKAIAVKPDYAAAHLNLGLLYEESLKQPAEAVRHYREYYRINGGKDLRVLPWIAEIEASQQPKTGADAPARETP